MKKRIRNLEEMARNQRRYRAKYPEKVKERNRLYCAKHPEKMRELKRLSYKRHPETQKRARERRLEYYKNHPEKVLENRLKQYGMTTADYNKMFIMQGGKCAICSKHQTELNTALHVDHCHESNIIRGLLCKKCNAGLGLFQDNIKIIKSAIKYLQKGLPEI